MENIKPSWLKSKGYIHITAQLEVEKRTKELVSKINNPDFVKKYAFFPLIHSNINERKFKKAIGQTDRAHSYKDEKGNYKKNIKVRPLHYASHFDALIFGYYAELLQIKYEELISKHNGLNECIIAYRKIPLDLEGKYKSTIHFANEIFEEIKNRSNTSSEECVVLTFDIKSFFPSLDHLLLKKAWSDLLNAERLPADHYNVFKASTQFSYILLDELRQGHKKKSKKNGFDEKELARIRNNFGIQALFESPKAFRDKVKDGSVKLYKYPFRNKNKIPTGIPQGLPISATLANLYLINFDLIILEKVVNDLSCYYRRYSDDIVIVCAKSQAESIENLVLSQMKANNVEISTNKTERFVFRKIKLGNKPSRLISVKLLSNGEHIGAPFNYLGFEFNGQKALVKSSNIAKFYRRMIAAVKSKAKRAKLMADQNPDSKLVLFRRQLYKLYTNKKLHNVKVRNRRKKIVKMKDGSFRLQSNVKQKILRSNYLSYIQRASKIMNEPAIVDQLKKHETIFNQAIHKYLKRNSN